MSSGGHGQQSGLSAQTCAFLGLQLVLALGWKLAGDRDFCDRQEEGPGAHLHDLHKWGGAKAWEGAEQGRQAGRAETGWGRLGVLSLAWSPSVANNSGLSSDGPGPCRGQGSKQSKPSPSVTGPSRAGPGPGDGQQGEGSQGRLGPLSPLSPLSPQAAPSTVGQLGPVAPKLLHGVARGAPGLPPALPPPRAQSPSSVLSPRGSLPSGQAHLFCKPRRSPGNSFLKAKGAQGAEGDP